MSKIHFDVVTLFPEFFETPFKMSLLGKAIKKDLISIDIHNLRDFGIGKHNQVDDRPFGGGPGMVLKPDCLAASLKKVVDTGKKKKRKEPYIILLDPSGNKFVQKKAEIFSKKRWVILICGHYEGVDERFKELYVDEEISIGDYILSGGEAAALVMVESISRLIPGFLGKKESVFQESFSLAKVNGKNLRLLDFPTYTRPEIFEGEKVPNILKTGNHSKIEDWRQSKSLERTKKLRPDLLK